MHSNGSWKYELRVGWKMWKPNFVNYCRFPPPFHKRKATILGTARGHLCLITGRRSNQYLFWMQASFYFSFYSTPQRLGLKKLVWERKVHSFSMSSLTHPALSQPVRNQSTVLGADLGHRRRCWKHKGEGPLTGLPFRFCPKEWWFWVSFSHCWRRGRGINCLLTVAGIFAVWPCA